MAASASLVVRVSAQIAEFQKSFDDASKTASKFADSFEGIATRAAAVGTFIGNVAKDLVYSMGRALGQAVSDAVRLSSEFNNAFIGLSSVARAFGTDAELAKDAARRLSSDGLLPLKDSATGLKNLLATGFSLDQAVRLMDAFKDSAAFGRQGALSFGDAIRSATEGVKNGNSILVDNAGVTKNLSQILKEAGFSAQDLSRASSDAGVRMALFNGILKETLAQTGDAARLTETYSGQVTRLSTVYDNLLGNLGDAITQNATVARALGIVSDAVVALSQHLSNNRNAFNYVSDAIIIFARGLSAMVNVVDVVQRSFQVFVVTINGLLGGFVDIGRVTFQLVERVENLQKVLDPLRFRQHAAAAEEARQAYEFLDKVASTLAKSTQTAMDQGQRWGSTLQGLKGTLDNVANELEETRGKTVELGVSSVNAGAALRDGLGGGADKAKVSAKELKEAVKSLKDDIEFVDERTQDLEKSFQEATKQAAIMAKELDSLKDDIRGVDEALADTDTKFWAEQAKEDFKSLRDEIALLDERVTIEIPVRPKLFGDEFGEELGRILGSAFTGGGVLNAVREAGSLIGATLGRGLAERLTSGANALTGWLGGMVSTALPIIGSLLGPLVGKIGDILSSAFGNRGRDAVKDFAASFGGFDALHARLLEMGSAGEALWIKLTQGVGRNNPAQAAAVIAEVTAALDAFGTESERAAARLSAIGTAIDGVNAKAALFASPFDALLKDKAIDDVTAKLAEMGQRGQAEFERIGTFAAAAFAGLVKETGDAIGAIERLAPTFVILQRGVNEFGLTSTGTIDALIAMFDLVNSTVTGPILQNISAVGQIFAGLQDAGLLTSELFQTVSDDIGASFRELEAKGGDVAKAMALSQPVLQRLFEAQQIYGQVTDETTQKILEQAEQQGLVGDHMKDVNKQILEVLIAIADVFGAKIPEGMRQTQRSATETAAAVEREFGNIKIPKIGIDVEFNVGKLPNPGLVELASGGIVRRPTLALVGEAGPEAVIPLSQLGSVSPSGGEMTAIFEIDGRQIAAATVPYLPGEIRRYVPA